MRFPKSAIEKSAKLVIAFLGFSEHWPGNFTTLHS
jgi:hypothetical protein